VNKVYRNLDWILRYSDPISLVAKTLKNTIKNINSTGMLVFPRGVHLDEWLDVYLVGFENNGK